MQSAAPCSRALATTFAMLPLQELKDFQRDGHSLEDLWKVAKGDIKYQDFAQRSIPRQGQQLSQQKVPEDLVSYVACKLPKMTCCMVLHQPSILQTAFASSVVKSTACLSVALNNAATPLQSHIHTNVCMFQCLRAQC